MADNPGNDSPLLRRLAVMDAMCRSIPRGFWGLVAVDPFEHVPGEELSLLAIYPSREEAEAALAATGTAERARKEWLPQRLFIYEGEGPPDTA
jgi:hypothetical protein